ncbi:hypothetical protein [Deinococcus alpinitundrae]|uniref:hypothetical protein n=1 Tax=Deinococcus alpinitundrae TaxID=468913 RepID=UPI00137ACBF2|nr:hypothetical protein [Deinococcus alpinitundrae]
MPGGGQEFLSGTRIIERDAPLNTTDDIFNNPIIFLATVLGIEPRCEAIQLDLNAGEPLTECHLYYHVSFIDGHATRYARYDQITVLGDYSDVQRTQLV